MEFERAWFAERNGRMAVREMREAREKIQSEWDNRDRFTNQKVRLSVQQIMFSGELETR
jgi:membrane-bound lytic murein transglycosylase MltF